MAKRVNLDAMIPRADLAVIGDDVTMDLASTFPISNLQRGNPIQVMLRKPDFQRETNHWTPNQILNFIVSFVDNELIPSLILWNSRTHIFVIDGGHRLSALRAWMEDDYGDGPISQAFYNGEISDDQKKIAKRTRQIVEKAVGRYSTLLALVGADQSHEPVASQRARTLFRRALNLQWVQGNAAVAESSFFKINNQGTPLDEVEEMLLRNRRKPVSIAARSIIRAGAGHKYWSSFPDTTQRRIEALAQSLFNGLFEPELNQPVKTLDLPLGGSTSPIDALSLLIEYLLAVEHRKELKTASSYLDDSTGDETVKALQNAEKVMKRMTGNGAGSLGLHPAIYFYTDRGRHNRFLFLAVTKMIAEKLHNNDSAFFKKFTRSRKQLERFLIEHKALIGLLLQNMSKGTRVIKIKDLLEYLITELSAGRSIAIAEAVKRAGASGQLIDLGESAAGVGFSDDTKSAVFINQALEKAIECPICGGYLDPAKSASFDHKKRVREGGKGEASNAQITHPFCNDGIKS